MDSYFEHFWGTDYGQKQTMEKHLLSQCLVLICILAGYYPDYRQRSGRGELSRSVLQYVFEWSSIMALNHSTINGGNYSVGKITHIVQ